MSAKNVQRLVKKPDGTYEWVDGPAHVGRSRHSEQKWPILSDGLGVHPVQVEEAEQYLRSQGVPTEFERGEDGGRCIVRSNRHQADICAAMGFHNNDGNYSCDYVKGTRHY